MKSNSGEIESNPKLTEFGTMYDTDCPLRGINSTSTKTLLPVDGTTHGKVTTPLLIIVDVAYSFPPTNNLTNTCPVRGDDSSLPSNPKSTSTFTGSPDFRYG